MVEEYDFSQVPDDDRPLKWSRAAAAKRSEEEKERDRWNQECIAEACAVRAGIGSMMQFTDLFHSFVEGGMEKEAAFDAAVAETGVTINERTRAALMKGL